MRANLRRPIFSRPVRTTTDTTEIKIPSSGTNTSAAIREQALRAIVWLSSSWQEITETCSVAKLQTPPLRCAAARPARVQRTFPDGVPVEEPCKESLEAESVPAVGRRAVLALVSVPVAV